MVRLESELGIKGKVLAVDLSRMECRIWPDETSSITLSFTPEQKNNVLMAFGSNESLRLRMRGRGEFTPEGQLHCVTNIASLDLALRDRPPPDPNSRSIGKIIDEIVADVPLEEWAKLPTDLSHRHDYYIYGVAEQR